MSKRLGNAVDPFATIEKFGSDPLRWYMIANSAPWDNLKFNPDGVTEVSRKLFSTLYNTYSFFALYANVDGFDPHAYYFEQARNGLYAREAIICDVLGLTLEDVKA